ncbi:hypothetical protein BN1221_02499 [Brenneria goodwinii]|uniref:Uncharacterized protein n=1 Tax=Brenneria goodwinii TaxID=1109412 RepID=A0A0G4JVY6_9GAMM|nr:hypothetical protein BN1221_02499 [Brenneria goodwinii]
MATFYSHDFSWRFSNENFMNSFECLYLIFFENNIRSADKS